MPALGKIVGSASRDAGTETREHLLDDGPVRTFGLEHRTLRITLRAGAVPVEHMLAAARTKTVGHVVVRTATNPSSDTSRFVEGVEPLLDHPFKVALCEGLA